jgi:hypothetical protein
VSAFTLEALGGPWSRRLALRRDGVDDLAWSSIAREATPGLVDAAREVWTRSAFSEYASGACFAEIASALLAARVPIDLSSAAGEFVADEMFHAELASRVAMALGGAVPLQVDCRRLVKPPQSERPLMRAAELIVRSCCVGEALTVPMLSLSRRAAGSRTIEAVITRILRDESQHAQLGWWFLDWADLSDGERDALGRLAGEAVRSFGAVFANECSGDVGLGRLSCAVFEGPFLEAVRRDVVEPLSERGIFVAREDVEALETATAAPT